VPMRCAFCGLKHYWRLIKYHGQDIPDVKHRHNAGSKKRASRLASSTSGAMMPPKGSPSDEDRLDNSPSCLRNRSPRRSAAARGG
jgi:hypothetical protein